MIAREEVLAPEFSSIEAWLGRPGNTWEQLLELAADESFDERLVTALHDVAMAGRVRRSRYEQSENLSVQQAQRDLRELVRRQILEPVGRTRARFYVAGARFPEKISEVARTPVTLRDPYRA